MNLIAICTDVDAALVECLLGIKGAVVGCVACPCQKEVSHLLPSRLLFRQQDEAKQTFTKTLGCGILCSDRGFSKLALTPMLHSTWM